ncbi:MAG: hypothetical protein CMP00_06280 [Woeseiaceae bacterium]|nr:hypothetical protein [Woeseiaceae bacterium]
MKNKFSTITSNSVIFLYMTVVLALWSARLLTEWGTDFGIYYAGAYFINDEYRLYKELFDHKGPLYYLFLKVVGSFIGWGSFQAYLSLFLTMLAFYIPAFLILLRQKLSPPLLLSGITLCLLLLFGQPTNSSIAFFQGAFLLGSFYFLTSTENNFAFAISIIFFVLAVFVRIDALVFFPIYLINAFFKDGDFSYKNIFLRLLFILTAFPVIFFLTSKYLGFGLYEFYEHNVVFNGWYQSKSILSMFYRPKHYSIISSSLIIIPVFLLRHRIYFLTQHGFRSVRFFLSPKDYGHQSTLSVTYCGIFFISTMLWIFTGSDKDYHILILTIPIVFIIISNVKYLNASRPKLLIYCLLALYPLAITIAHPSRVIIQEPECISDPYCSSSKIVRYAESIDFLRNRPEPEVSIIGGRGWAYFYSGKRPTRSLNDWWLYWRPDPFLTESLKQQHEALLRKRIGTPFLIDNDLLVDVDTKSPLLREILADSVLIQGQDRYSIYRVVTSIEN